MINPFRGQLFFIYPTSWTNQLPNLAIWSSKREGEAPELWPGKKPLMMDLLKPALFRVIKQIQQIAGHAGSSRLVSFKQSRNRFNVFFITLCYWTVSSFSVYVHVLDKSSPNRMWMKGMEKSQAAVVEICRLIKLRLVEITCLTLSSHPSISFFF